MPLSSLELVPVPGVPRPALLAGAGLLGVLAVGVVVAVAVPGERVPSGVSVSGIDVGGLPRAEAEARLREGLAERATAVVQLRAAGEAVTLDPAKSGLSLDLPATVERAVSTGPLGRAAALVGADREVSPVVEVDEVALSAQLQQVAAEFDRQPVEGSITFDEQAAPTPVQPVVGRVLDVEGAVDAVREQWLSDPSSRIEVPVDVSRPRTGDQEVQRALDEVAKPAVAAPVTVDVEGKPLVVEPRDIAKALRLEPGADGMLVPRLLEPDLYEQVRFRLRTVGEPPVDATFDVSSGTPVLVPSEDGRSVSPPDLARAVQGVLTAPAPRTASASLSVVPARITTAQARTLGVREMIGTFTTKHPCCRPRVENIHRIADILDGYVVLPGEEFDLNAVVGPRDEARGFVPAPQILEGEFVDAVGGGISQFATTLFNAVFFSGLQDVTHTPHSYYISRYPPGREATVSFPKPDLIFRNDSPNGVLIDTSYTGTSITVTFWGAKRFDEVKALAGPRTRIRDFETRYVQRPDCTRTAGGKGFDILVTRVFVDGGVEVRREEFQTRYLPEPRFICGPPPRSKARRPSSTPGVTAGSAGAGGAGGSPAPVPVAPAPSPAG